MIWLTWRQFRAQAWVALAALAAIAAALAVTGAHLARLYAISGIATCHAHADCGTVATGFLSQVHASMSYNVLYHLGIGILFAVPAVIGIFWGAPLVTRELETGSYRLAWNQSVTRTRWMAVKLGLIGLAAMAATGLLTLMVTWWASPVDRAAGIASSRNGSLGDNRFSPTLFAAHGIAPIGYAAFAFALGVTAGVLIRRTVPAMAVTLVVFAAVQLVMPLWIRPHLVPPRQSVAALNPALIDEFTTTNGGQMTVTAGVNLPGAWVIANQTVDAAGQVFTGPAPPACLSNTASMQACQASVGRLHLRQLVTYQPASRYWAFQWYETGIFAVLAIALAGLCFWRIGRRYIS